MADMGVFLFSSPRKTASKPKYRPASGPRAKLGKRRRLAKMDVLSQHACMARFDEPTFCANDVSDILLRYAVPLPGSATPAEPLVPELSDGDEEDTGGVSLQQDDVDDDFHTASTQQQRGGAADSSAAGSLPTSVLGTSHPRPHTQELWDEEDSRRLRFALDGFDTSEVPRFIEPHITNVHDGHELADSSAVRRLSQTQVTQQEEHTSRSDVAPTNDATQSRWRGSSSRTDVLDLTAVPAAQQELPSHEPMLVVDDDRIAVDDPRRNYDFADFIDTWRLRSLSDKRLPMLFTPEVQPSVRLWRPPDVLTRSDIVSGTLDMQAIRWPMMGPTRNEALMAREWLHPARSSTKNGAGPPLSSPSVQRLERDDSQYRFRSFTPKHIARSPHYQLRNVVAAVGRSDIFLANGSKVMRASLASPASQDTVMDLSKPLQCTSNVRITCLATSPPTVESCRLLIAGGFYGEYAILRLDEGDDSTPHNGFVTHAYNGLVTHVHTYTGRHTNTHRAAFCSNDHQLRLMDTATLQFTNTFQYDSAINCSATSRDGRLRVLVSDCSNAYITDAEGGDTLVTLQGHKDHSFACAWAPNGVHVATGSEDGRTLVWDARRWSQPLRSLPSVMSCPRSLHFDDAGALVVAEDDDVVSIYEPDTFNKRQDIRFFGSIAGAALLNGGAEMVVANADKTGAGLLAFERTDQGLNKGTFGERMTERPRDWRWRVPSRHSDLLSGVSI